MTRRQFHLGLLASGLVAATSSRSWAAPSWKVAFELRHSSDINVEQIELSPDLKTVSCWATDGSLMLWDLGKRQTLWARGDSTRLIGTNNKVMMCVDKGDVKQIALANGQESMLYSSLDPNCVSPNGEWWAGLKEQKAITLFNSKTMKLVPLSVPPAVYRTETRLFHFSECSKWLVVAQGVRNVLWEIEKPDDPIVLEDLPGEITNVWLTRDAGWVISGGIGGYLDIYNRKFPRQSQRAQYQGDVRGLWVDSASNQALVGCSEGGLQPGIQPLPSLKKPSALPAEPLRLPPSGETWSCCLRGKMAATGHRGGLIKIWKWA